jgi:type II secretory pathway pseudopilin PulG
MNLLKRLNIPRNRRALTLVEVLVSIMIAGTILGALSAPMAVGVINRRQGQNLTLATNAAQAEIESIRGGWGNSAISADSKRTLGQVDYDSNNINVAWSTANVAGAGCVPNPGATLNSVYPASSTLTANDTANALLSDVAQVAPNSASIPAAVRNIPIDTNGDCVQDYWGQIILGRAPSGTSGAAATTPLSFTKRVVVRIFRVQTDPGADTMNFIPANPGKPQLYLTGKANQQNGVSSWNLPLAVLIVDIPRSDIVAPNLTLSTPL